MWHNNTLGLLCRREVGFYFFINLPNFILFGMFINMAVYYKKPYARKYRYSRSMRSGFPYKKRGFGKPKVSASYRKSRSFKSKVKSVILNT